MNGIYLLLGSNIGDRLDNLKTAIDRLGSHNIVVIDESSVYETAPWGEQDQAWFLNVVLQIDTPQNEADLLTSCMQTENEMGRVRNEKWGARIIDIDILYYHDTVMDTESLIIPHPGIATRRFTLIPLAELCPNELHPVLHLSQAELLLNCEDPLDCKLTEFTL
ncbi:MAG: 2-amino-4-hydroxy-6-hydroxymethyldihydropteridine diphosphokinase [Bacteroidota bacterium]